MKQKHGNGRVMVKGQLNTHEEVEGLSSAVLRDDGGVHRSAVYVETV